MIVRTESRRSSGAAVLRSRVFPNLAYETRAWASGHDIVAGVDEAGRGAWAGPLVAAAAIVPRDGTRRARLTRALGARQLNVDDSKRLSHKQRGAIQRLIIESGIIISIAVIPVEEIDQHGVGRANRSALSIAASGLSPSPEHLLVDGFQPLDPPCSCDAIIRGDACSIGIAMASIAAKVHRDELMDQLHQEFPGYGFSRHKGYGTAAHREALERLGPCSQHRRSFAPIAAMMCRDRE